MLARPVLRLRATLHGTGIKNAPKILDEAIVGGLTGIGKLLIPAVQGRMKVFRGAERKSVKAEVTGKRIDRSLDVFSELVQAFVDELGLPAGVFPPWDVGTLVYQWVKGRGLRAKTPAEQHYKFKAGQRGKRGTLHVRQSANARRGRQYTRKSEAELRRPLKRRSKAQQTALRTNARKRARANETRRLSFLVARGIFEHGLKANKPFATTFKANQARILREIQNAFTRAVKRINTV